MIEMQPNETEMFQTVAKTVVPILLRTRGAIDTLPN
jgi:hypothetical protein